MSTTQSSSWILWQQAWNVLDTDEERLGEAEEDRLDGLDDIIHERVQEKERFTASREIEEAYTGPVVEEDGELDVDLLQHLIHHFNQGYVLPYLYAENLCNRFLSYLKGNIASLQRANTIPGGKLVVVGDIHGQYPDLITVLDLIGESPSEKNIIVLNGDIVDRGPHCPEVLFMYMCLKLLYPQYVYINRGNHELKRMNDKYSFKEQMLDMYDLDLYRLVVECFDHLPFCTVINSKIFIVHGGLFEYNDVTLAELESLTDMVGKDVIRRPKMRKREEFLCDNMLWSDPDPTISSWRESSRNAGILFGEERVTEFLDANDLDIVVRSHQIMDEGYEFLFGNKFLTVFSASEYTGAYDNQGAIAIFPHGGDNNNPEIKQYKAYILSKEEKN
eukprot:TRINITY_DN6730_c0_g1_i1.p1 TRINITY_DN6730_c0_g1~~TRINITY_DN6730_c0_g1_i1.p1  ORF type:complete len:389 (+),score=84.86 TRINITY_DN6730_c0_g1_i1:20-1186(+)